MQRKTRKIYKVEMIADSVLEEDFLYFLGVFYSSIKLDQEMLQYRADLPRKTKRKLLFACIITSNITILAKGFITPRMAKNLIAVYPSVE